MQGLSRAAAVAALCSLSALAGTHLHGNGKALSWKDGKVTLRVSRTVHWEGGDGTGVDRREPASSAHAAIFEAIRSWERPGRGRIEIDLDFTDVQTVSAGENVVTFTDPAPFDTGVCDKQRHISCTLISFTEDGGIASASVAFNPYKRHSSLGLAGTHDLGLIMMHEMGHVLGLNHSFTGGSVMLAEAESEPAEGSTPLFALRRLSEDDLSTLALLYPKAGAARIAGTVRREGEPLAAARVIALDAAGRIRYGSFSGEDGSFALAVVPGAGYRVAADPDDGPAAFAHVDEPIEVAGDASVEGVEITLAPPGPKPRVDSVGLVADGSYAGLPRVDLARGAAHAFALTHSPAGVPVELLFPRPAIVPEGEPSWPVNAPRLVRQTIQVDPLAAPGDYALLFRSGDALGLLAGPLRIVTRPVVKSVEDAETGALAVEMTSGRRYRLRGEDLAETEAEALREFDGAPLPAQLNGVSVRLGERFLPLVSVGPAELLFEYPAGGVKESSAFLSVSSGTTTTSKPVLMHLAPAPEAAAASARRQGADGAPLVRLSKKN